MSATSNPRPLLLTMGDPAGVGPELAALAWALREEHRLPAFTYIGDANDLLLRAKQVGLSLSVHRLAVDETCACFAACFADALPVIHQPLTTPSTAGTPDTRNARAVIAAIDLAVSLVARGAARGIVTGPIQKSTLKATGFPFPGHTEYLGALTQRYFTMHAYPVMMLASRTLRVVPVTTHIPLCRVSKTLTKEQIVRIGRLVAQDLRTFFRIEHPRIAVCALNPHAGENGTMGLEEIQIITPAISALCAKNIEAEGPFPADTLFHQAARNRYDAVFAMYHDQALIPIKTIAFEETVNVTLGLPFVRTSPAHGTALDLAGSGQANPSSLIEAIRLAAALSR